MPNNMNMHRNVFFKDCGKVPAMPFSALDSPHPEDLWTWMDGQRKAGNDLLAISHNANVSDGRMFPTEVDFKGRPIDAAYAASRVRNEPLIEIKQIKGTSETHPLLSPNDEFGGFEIMSFLLGDPSGRIPHIVGQLRAAGAEGRHRDAGHEGLQPVQVRIRRGLRLAQHRVSPTARTTSSARMGQPTARSKPACPAVSPPAWTRACREHRRPHRRVGGREHARVAVRSDAAQGDVRGQRPAHQGAALRRMGVHAPTC